MHQPISRKVELYKPRNGEAGTETCRVVKPSSVKTKEPPSPCGFTYGIAVYGPVCTVVWEGRAGNRSPYPDCTDLYGAQPPGPHCAPVLRTMGWPGSAAGKAQLV